MDPSNLQFELKNIRFLGRVCNIVCQNENGPCPLLALSNALILLGKITFHNDLRIISLQELTVIVANKYIEAVERRTSTLNANEAALHQNQLDEVLSMLPSLARGLDLNVIFSENCSSFEYTKELTVFDTLGIGVYHGWLLDPADRVTAKVVNSLSYNHLMFKLVDYKSLADRDKGERNFIFQTELPTLKSPGRAPDESLQNPLHAAPLQAPIPPPQIAGHPTSPSADDSGPSSPPTAEKKLLEEGPIIEAFLQNTASQLTYHGLVCLHQTMKDNQLAVFFRNNHFSTIYKRNGALYLLVTDSGYSREPRVVWECLDEIDGATDYVDGDFLQPQWNTASPPIQVPSVDMNGSSQAPHAAASDSSTVRVGDVVIPKSVLENAGLSTTVNGNARSGSSPPASAAAVQMQATSATASALRAADQTGDPDLVLAMQLQEEEERLQQLQHQQRMQVLQDEELVRVLQQQEAARSPPGPGHHHPPPQHHGQPHSPPMYQQHHPHSGVDSQTLAQQQRALDYYRHQQQQQQQRQERQAQGSNCTIS